MPDRRSAHGKKPSVRAEAPEPKELARVLVVLREGNDYRIVSSIADKVTTMNLLVSAAKEIAEEGLQQL